MLVMLKFELVMLKILQPVLWTVVLEKTLLWIFFGSQSILKEISPGFSLEGLMLMLKLQ